MKATIIFYLCNAKINQSSRKVPIYLRVILNRTKAKARLNAEVHEKDLLKWDPITMRFNDRDIDINHQLNNIDQEFRKFLILNETRLSSYTAKQVRDIVMGTGKNTDMTLAGYVDQYLKNVVMVNKELSEDTKKNYRIALNHLRNFIALERANQLLIKDVGNSFAIRFKDFLSPMVMP